MAEKEINASEEKSVEQSAEIPATASSAPEKKKPSKKEAAPSLSTAAPATQDENGGLQSLDELALAFRTPSWRQGALMRMMGWEQGKMVTKDEYGQAVERLSGRKMGGGRL